MIIGMNLLFVHPSILHLLTQLKHSYKWINCQCMIWYTIYRSRRYNMQNTTTNKMELKQETL